jgi:hypothetical protein
MDYPSSTNELSPTNGLHKWFNIQLSIFNLVKIFRLASQLVFLKPFVFDTLSSGKICGGKERVGISLICFYKFSVYLYIFERQYDIIKWNVYWCHILLLVCLWSVCDVMSWLVLFLESCLRHVLFWKVFQTCFKKCLVLTFLVMSCFSCQHDSSCFDW